MPDYLGKLDQLIGKLEEALEKPVPEQIVVAAGDPPKRAQYRILAETYTGIAARKPRPAEVRLLTGPELLMVSQKDVARKMPVEVTVFAGKNEQGETIHVAQGEVSQMNRVSGAYEIRVDVSDLREVLIPAHKRFMEFVTARDTAGWNRWCSGLKEGVALRELDLTRADLSNCDLCCADLSGADLTDADLSGAILSGADLTGCCLEGVAVNGADFFRAKLPRKFMGLLLASGMVEVESVILV